MNIRQAVGNVSVTVESPMGAIQIELGGIEMEMTDITPKEYIEILRAKNEISKLNKEAIHNVIGGIKEAFQGSTPTKKQESKKTSEEAMEELISQLPFFKAAKQTMGEEANELPKELLEKLPFLKGAKVVKFDPKVESFDLNNPFGPGGLFHK